MQISADITESRSNVSLSELTGFKTGGNAKKVLIPQTVPELIEIQKQLDETDAKRYILGKGTNVIAKDEGYDGAIILTTGLTHIEMKDNLTVVCEAGVPLTELCRFAQKNSLSGLESLYGIPGTVGGAVFMNAGAYSTEIKDVLSKVFYLAPDYSIKELSAVECDFGYRQSRFMISGETIVGAEFTLKDDIYEDIENRMNSTIESRKEHQPLEYCSCGSTFKRPLGTYASKLIDECGLKGFRIGGAMVSTKHAGFIINCDNACSNDIFSLIQEIQRIVLDRTGYLLEKEVRILE